MDNSIIDASKITLPAVKRSVNAGAIDQIIEVYAQRGVKRFTVADIFDNLLAQGFVEPSERRSLGRSIAARAKTHSRVAGAVKRPGRPAIYELKGG